MPITPRTQEKFRLPDLDDPREYIEFRRIVAELRASDKRRSDELRIPEEPPRYYTG